MTWLLSDRDLALLLAGWGLPWLVGTALLLTWATWGTVAVLRGLWRGARLGRHIEAQAAITAELPHPTTPDDPTLTIHVPEARHA